MFILSCRNPRWGTRITMKTILLCILIDVFYFQFWDIRLLGIYVLQSNNVDYLDFFLFEIKDFKEIQNDGSKMADARWRLFHC